MVKSATTCSFKARLSRAIQQQIWKAWALKRCKFWLASLSKYLTADNLAKRGWDHSLICQLCIIRPEAALLLITNWYIRLSRSLILLVGVLLRLYWEAGTRGHQNFPNLDLVAIKECSQVKEAMKESNLPLCFL